METTEQKIINAAREEFIATGLKGARMQSIADRAGVNKALLYNYFRSKEVLFEASMGEVVELLWSFVENDRMLTWQVFDFRSMVLSYSLLQVFISKNGHSAIDGNNFF